MSPATFLSVKALNVPSLNTRQFWKISTNEAPRCACARFSTPMRCGWRVSIERATKRAPAPRANAPGETGLSIDPSGVDGERVPRRDVGEYCPLVSP